MNLFCKRLLSLAIAGAYIAGMAVTMPSLGKREGFSKRVYGPGVNNLSSSDYHARYQWALRNDGELQYLEIVNKFREINPPLARQIDLSNMFGIPAPVEGPDAYELETTNAKRGIDINIQPAWKLHDSHDDGTHEHRQVIVAVIDTGIDISHPELKDSMWVNEDEIPGDGIDNDGNGYIDDVNGWNFFSNTNQIFVGQEEDDHGTHAAGTIAAARGNGGIAGIADPDYVKIMSVKALGTEEGLGEENAVIAAIQYAEANGASICNLSFGTTDYYPRLKEVMQNSKMLFVTSAGNGDSKGNGINIDTTGDDYPSSFHLPNVISVANLMFDGNLAVSSNYGVNTVDIAAPGTYIVSTIPNGFGYMTGTSMAAPMVTGVAAMVYSCRTDLSLGDVRNVILQSVHKLEGLDGKVSSGGMLDAYAALTYGLQQ